MTRPARSTGDLAGLDALEVDTLVLPLFEGRAQPLGVAGHVDWRLSGRLARLVRGGRFTGARGERVLMTALDRVRASRVLLWGLGPAVSWASDKDDLPQLVSVLADAGALSVAVAVPRAPEGSPPSAAVAEAWQASSAWARLGAVPVTLLDLAPPS